MTSILKSVVFLPKLFYPNPMNSHLKSVGKNFPFVLTLALPLVFTLGCGLISKDEKSQEAESVVEQLTTEVSVKADREYLAEERQNIPDEIKTSNDELAYDLEQMAVVKDDPNRIRSKFQSKVRKIRDRFRKKTRKLREDFRRDERKTREAFLKSLKKEREEFKQDKPDRERSKEFFAEQDLKRKDFFANQKEKRSEFEEEMRAQSRDFNDSMRERVRQFNDQLRIYTRRYQEQKKCERQGNCENASNSPHPPRRKQVYDMKEFEDMKSVPGVLLAPKKSGK